MIEAFLDNDLNSVPFLLAGGVLFLVTLDMGWRARRRWMMLVYGVLVMVAIGLLVAGGALYWYTHRPRPEPVQQTLFSGIEYTREIRNTPRPINIHVIRIDLDASGVAFMVTPHTPTGDRALAGRTTSEFLDEFSLQVAINGDFFAPWWSRLPWDYYPRSGDPVDVNGLSASLGDVYTRGIVRPNGNTVYISAENSVSFTPPADSIYNAITGFGRIVRNGQPNMGRLRGSYTFDPHPRTAIALDQTGETLLLVVVDGRQPNYSEGVTLPELATILIEFGGWEGLNLDGGGSSTLVIAGEDGPDVLNSPIHTRIPGRERPIANHLGVFALPAPE